MAVPAGGRLPAAGGITTHISVSLSLSIYIYIYIHRYEYVLVHHTILHYITCYCAISYRVMLYYVNIMLHSLYLTYATLYYAMLCCVTTGGCRLSRGQLRARAAKRRAVANLNPLVRPPLVIVYEASVRYHRINPIVCCMIQYNLLDPTVHL